VGSPATHRALTGHLARRCKARVFAADYRLAPEHPFPAAIEDAVAACAGLLEEGYAPRELVLAGDSAGGGLCVATALKLREAGLPQPGALVLFSPWTDLSLEQLGEPPPGEAMITRSWTSECAGFYLAGRDAHEPLASPVFADLRGLPRTLVQVGTDELLRPDSERMHARLLAAGVTSRLGVYPRRWHVFQMHAGVLRDADRALDEVATFLAA
jgi:acetyl esterase/lipase